MKYISIIILGLLSCNISDSPLESIDIPREYIKSSPVINLSEAPRDTNALINAGRLIGFTRLRLNGAACFGSCHNFARGGNPDDAFAEGGGKIHRIRNLTNSIYGYNEGVRLPEDVPIFASMQLMDTGGDTVFLSHALTTDNIFEDQFIKAMHAHHMQSLESQLQYDIDIRRLMKKAYGDDMINQRRIQCALSAIQGIIISSESNISKGKITKKNGFKKFDSYCGDCHVRNIKAYPSFVETDSLHRFVKSGSLSAWILSESDFHTSLVMDPRKNRLMQVINHHKFGANLSSEYNDIVGLNYFDIKAIESFIIHDLTDYNGQRYEVPKLDYFTTN